MRITNEETGLTYQLNFKHHYKQVISKNGRVIEGIPGECGTYYPIEFHPFATTAYLRVLDKDLNELSCLEGYAECGKKDKFSRKVGRSLSFYRALEPFLNSVILYLCNSDNNQVHITLKSWLSLLSEKDKALVNQLHFENFRT